MSASPTALAHPAAGAPELDPEQIAMLRGLRKGEGGEATRCCGLLADAWTRLQPELEAHLAS